MLIYVDKGCPRCDGTGVVEMISPISGILNDYGCPRCIGIAMNPAGVREGVDDEELIAVGVPRRHAWSNFSDLRPNQGVANDAMLSSARRYSLLLCPTDGAKTFARSGKGKTNSLLFHGQAGTGKTVIAVAIMRDAMRQGYSCRFVDHPGLIYALRPRDQYNPQDFIDSMVMADVLVVDDLGKARETEWTQQQLYLVINERYNQMLPTIITTNLDPHASAFVDHVGQATASRILAMCAVRP